MIAAMMVLQGIWKGAGVFNIEQLDPEPFLETLAKNGLPYQIVNRKPLPAKI